MKTVSCKNYITSNNSIDGFQYVGEMLNFFPTAEGYVRATPAGDITPGAPPTGYAYSYVFNYTDHLGNVRLSYSMDHLTGKLKILEENHYYPFGLRHEVYLTGTKLDFSRNPGDGIEPEPGLPPLLDYVTRMEYQYKYQGQELQDELGLNWYSFKWRNYDPAIGRFFNVDPLSEKYVYQGHYNFSENRVIDARELEGLESALLKVLAKYGKKGYDYVARTVKGDLKPISREQAVKKLQNKESVYSTGSAKDAKKLMKQSTEKKVMRDDGHVLDNGKKGLDHYQKKSGDGSHVFYGVDKSVAPVVVASTSEEGVAIETKTEEKSTMQKISDFASDTLDSIENFLSDFILDGGIPLLSPAPLGGGEQQWIENKNKRDFEEWKQQHQKDKQEKEEKQNHKD